MPNFMHKHCDYSMLRHGPKTTYRKTSTFTYKSFELSLSPEYSRQQVLFSCVSWRAVELATCVMT